MVSRAHALIVIDSDEVYIRDLASRNKVFVNVAPVREVALKAADLLEIGPYRFRCWAGFNGSATGNEDEPPVAARVVFAGSGRTHPIASRTLLIGRRPECDVTLTLQTVSRVHAVIFRRGGRHFVRDLNSKAGTIVNGEKIREVELNDGDELRIAAFTLRYQSGEATADGNGEAAVGFTQPVGELSGSGAWLSGSGLSGTGLMSGSASFGSQTSAPDGSAAEQSGTQEALLEGPVATPDELGLPAAAIAPPAADSVDPGELFPTEIQTGAAAPTRPQNGNGSH